jgi:two-component system sensor histidine kinase UhpB
MDKYKKALKLLIIEDNPGDLFLLQEHLRMIDLPNEVYHVTALSEVKEVLNKNEMDLCFLDLSLPDSNGIHSFITLNSIIPYTPIIILSGLADMEVSLEAISLGAQEYLLKGDYDDKLLSKSIQYSIERKKMLEKLRSTNERYELVNQATNDTIWEWDLVNNKTYWGEGISKVFGYLKEEETFKPEWAWNNIHPEDRERVVSNVQEHIKQRKLHYQEDFRYRCADGSFKNVSSKGYLLIDKNDIPFKMIGAMVDITDKVRLEEELTEQKLLIQKKLTEAAIQAQENEKEELGRELHDNINQILASSKMYLNLGTANVRIREEMILKSTENISHAIEEIRKLSKSLIVPSLGEVGLKQLVTDLTKNISDTTGITVTLTFSDFDEKQVDK